MKPQTETESKTIKLQDEWSKDQVFKIGKFTLTVSHLERIREKVDGRRFQKDSLALDIDHNGKSIFDSYVYGETEI